MSDQNQREWPSFNDILEELNTLGGLSSSAVVPETVEPEPIANSDSVTAAPVGADETDWTFEAADLFEPKADAESSDLQTPAVELPEGDEFGVSFEAPAPVVDESAAAVEPALFEPIVPESTTSDAIDWSNWDFESNVPSTAELSPPPITEEVTPVTDSGEAGGVFEFDTDEIEADAEVEVEFVPVSTAADDQDVPIDSVATADEIEDDLQELFSMVEVDETEASEMEIEEQTEAPADATELASLEALGVDQSDTDLRDDAMTQGLAAAVEAVSGEAEQPDNVVPLHPDPVDYTDDVVGLDGVFDPGRPQPVEQPAAAAQFVGVDEDEPDGDDKWDYLRPGDDEGVAGSFWSKRPKFFGGDERKAKKAARRQAEEDQILTGPPCPKCGAPGHVDLDDPIGGKLHLSCHKCDHVWSQLAEARPESA